MLFGESFKSCQLTAWIILWDVDLPWNEWSYCCPPQPFGPKRGCKNFEWMKYLVHTVTWKTGLATETPKVAPSDCKGCGSAVLRAFLRGKLAVQWNICSTAIKKWKHPKPVRKKMHLVKALTISIVVVLILLMR